MVDFSGKTVLVIAGGPSVPSDLARLTEKPDIVLSANQHGCMQEFFKPDYIVAISESIRAFDIDTRLMARRYLMQFNVPIIARFFWADIRLRDWEFNKLDCGVQSIAIAAYFGAARVIATGIDGFIMGRKYFHGYETILCQESRIGYTWQAKRLKQWLDERELPARVLPMSGYLTEHFEEWK